VGNRINSLSQVKTGELEREVVLIKELDDAEFLVTELHGGQKGKWERENAVTKGGRVVKLNTATMTPRLLAMAVIDENGDPIATVEQWATFIREVGAGKIAKLESVAQRLSGITSLDEDDQDGEENFSPKSRLSSID